ncbi:MULTISPECIES: hypothetical protein [Pontibacillus]|uniref:Uncharacterized protein n=1 Tax=Pontibacillus chungwhensis TaxID=265426 RepID=A0ABY8V3B7_9BACI|nr:MULTISPECIES: hypothetical protein [Pontibacillus]MCD5326144.1 hypothetical protein [Pontibacillus sp. HN14]WIG00298.1 hypothetical protein QNI29_21060 [Pontibacillus chungwhensis]
MGLTKSKLLKKSSMEKDVYLETIEDYITLRVLSLGEIEELQEESTERLRNEEGINQEDIEKIQKLEEDGEIHDQMSVLDMTKLLRSKGIDVDPSKLFFNKNQNEYIAKVIASGLNVKSQVESDEGPWDVESVKELNTNLFMELYAKILEMNGKGKTEEVSRFRKGEEKRV